MKRGTFVIKAGGSTLEQLPSAFYRDVVQAAEEGFRPVVVHGGGPAINQMLQRLGVESRFEQGLRVTDGDVLQVVEMVLAGSTNKRLVTALNTAGGRAVGVSGADDGMVRAEVRQPVLGYVGEVREVRTDLLQTLSAGGWIPVVATLGVDGEGQHLNVNADTTAAAVAKSLSADRLIMVTDVEGVYLDVAGQRRLVPRLTAAEVERHIADGQITGGMIPKVRAALSCLDAGVPEVVILSGTVPGALTRYLNGEHLGTVFWRGE